MSKGTLITGATGFIGRNLLLSLLEDGNGEGRKFHCLCRSDSSEKALYQGINPLDSDRVDVERGDLTKPYLGLGEKRIKELGKTVDRIIHCGASTSFDNNEAEEIRAANVAGTQHLIDLAKRFPHLEVIDHMSTAYVAGGSSGGILVPEARLTGVVPKNIYEETKLEAENRVRDSGLPARFIRESSVVGHSDTFDHQKERKVVYGFIKATLMATMAELGGRKEFAKHLIDSENGKPPAKISLRLKGDPNANLNMVCIDNVVDSCMAAMQDPRTLGQTFHIVNPKNISYKEMEREVGRIFNVEGYKFVKDFDPERDSATELEEMLYNGTEPFHPYALDIEPKWETKNADALGVKRAKMTPTLFRNLVSHFVEDSIGSYVARMKKKGGK